MDLQPGHMVYYLKGSPPTCIRVGYILGQVESKHVDDLWRLACDRPDSTLWYETRVGNIFDNIWDALHELENRINWQIDHYRKCLKSERKRVRDMVTVKAEL